MHEKAAGDPSVGPRIRTQAGQCATTRWLAGASALLALAVDAVARVTVYRSTARGQSGGVVLRFRPPAPGDLYVVQQLDGSVELHVKGDREAAALLVALDEALSSAGMDHPDLASVSRELRPCR